MVQGTKASSSEQAPHQSHKLAMVEMLSEGLASAADDSLLWTLERLLKQNDELRQQVEWGTSNIRRLQAEEKNLRDQLHSALTTLQNHSELRGVSLTLESLKQQNEDFLHQQELHATIISRLRSQEQLIRKQMQEARVNADGGTGSQVDVEANKNHGTVIGNAFGRVVGADGTTVLCIDAAERLRQELEDLREEMKWKAFLVQRYQEQDRRAHQEIEALKSHLKGSADDSSLAATVEALQRSQQANDELRQQLELKQTLIIQLESSEARLCNQLSQICKAQSPDVAAVVDATVLGMTRLKNQNAELQRECDWQKILLNQLQDTVKYETAKPALEDGQTGAPLTDDFQKKYVLQAAQLKDLQDKSDVILDRLQRMADAYVQHAHTTYPEPDAMVLLRKIEVQLQSQARLAKDANMVLLSPAELALEMDDNHVLTHHLAVMQKRISTLESQLADTEQALRDSIRASKAIQQRMEDAERLNMDLTYQTEVQKASIHDLERQLQASRSTLQATRGQVTELTVQYEDRVSELTASVADLGMEVETLRSDATQAGNARMIADSELFKVKGHRDELREKVIRFHALLQPRLAGISAALQNLDGFQKTVMQELLSHKPAMAISPSSQDRLNDGMCLQLRAAERHVATAASSLQALLASLLEIEHALKEVLVTC